MADRVESRHEQRRPRELAPDKVRSYIHQLYGGERGERQRHSAPTGSDPQRAREPAASTSRVSRLSEQRPFWSSGLTRARQVSRESAPPAELLDRVIADKLETLTKAKPTDSVQELTSRNVARHDKRLPRPAGSREKQQRVAAWLQQVDTALAERRRQPPHQLVAEPRPGRTVELAERRVSRRS